MRLNDDDIAAVAIREIERAQGYESDVLATKRAAALALYQGAAPSAPDAGVPEAEKSGRSGVVSLDVADSMHALMAQLGPVLKSSLVEFEPESQDDVEAAQMESDVVRRTLERSDAYGCLSSTTHDACLIGNGWLFLDHKEYTYTRVQRFPADTPVEAFAGLPEGVKMEVGDEEIIVTLERKKKRLVVESVPPEEMLFSGEPGIENLQDLRMVGRRRYYTQAALMGMGFKREDVEAIPDATIDYPAERVRQGMYADDSNLDSVQDATRLKEVFLVWLRVDISDSGNDTKLLHLWIGGRKLLSREDAEYIPFVTGSAVPMPHRIQGMGLGELLAQIQLAKTQTLRDFLDNLGALNASRVGALEGEVNMGDLTNGRVNGVVRMRRADALFPLPAADIGPQAMAGLGYLDQVRGQRVGAALDQTEVQAQLMTASATAAAGQLAQVEMITGWFADNLVNTLIKPLYILAHRMLRDGDEPLMAQVGDQWVQSDPRDWQERTIVQTTRGLTTAQRTLRQMALQTVISQQQQMLQAGLGGQLTSLAKLYNAMVDWARASDIPDPSQYLINPASPAAQQAAQQASQQQQQQQQMMMQLQQQIVQQQQQFELEKQRRELEYKRWSDELQAQVDEMKATASGTLDALRIRNESLAREQDRAALQEQKHTERRQAMTDSAANEPDEAANDSAPSGEAA